MKIKRDEAIEIVIKSKRAGTGRRKVTNPKSKRIDGRAARRRLKQGWRFFDAGYLRNAAGEYETPADFYERANVRETATPCSPEIYYPSGRVSASEIGEYIKGRVFNLSESAFNRARLILPQDKIEIKVVTDSFFDPHPLDEFADYKGGGVWVWKPERIAEITYLRLIVRRELTEGDITADFGVGNSFINSFLLNPDLTGTPIVADLTKPADLLFIPTGAEFNATRSDTVESGTAPAITFTFTNQFSYPFIGTILRDTCYNSASPLYGVNFRKILVGIPGAAVYKKVSYFNSQTEESGCLSSAPGGDPLLQGFQINLTSSINTAAMLRQNGRIYYQ